MSRKQLQELLRNLQEFYACPSCGAHYRPDNIKVLGQVDQYCFVQLGCASCSMPVLATVASEQPEKKLPRDVPAREARKFARKGSITALEIAGFHEFISGYKGDLHKLS